MKKVVSLLLSLLLALSSVVIVGASDILDNEENTYLYKDRFIEEYGYMSGSWGYNELYYHYADDNTIDWVLVRAHIYIMVEPTENPIYRDYVMGDVVYSTCYIYAPFETEYGIYDVAKDEFLDITKIDFEQYSGLKKIVYEEIGGRPIGNLFKDKFVEQYMTDYDGVADDYFYNELYYHYDENGQVDWVLVSAQSMLMLPWLINQVICDRVLMSYNEYTPFSFGYAVYDVKNDCFVEISESMLSYYDGLRDYWESQKVGKLIGDADSDDELTILDATYIQRALAKLCDFAENDEVEGYGFSGTLKYISDFDRDGDRTILDATAIQRRLAGLDEKQDDDLVIRQAKSFDFSILPPIPEDSTSVEFELLYTYDDFMRYPCIYYEDYYEDVYAIIKSKEQYDEVLNIYNDEFDEEFFENHYAVVSVRRVANLGALAPVTDMCIKDNTLYFVAEETYLEDVFVSPAESFYTSIVAVEKSALKDVTEIQRVKPQSEPIDNNDLVINQNGSIAEMPQNTELIEHEFLYVDESLTSPVIYSDSSDRELFAIIKTKVQYDEVLDIYNNRFSEEFFDDKYLVVSVRYVSNTISSAPITDLRVLDNTLYIRADEDNNQSSQPLPPIGQYCTSIVSVDKELLKGVSNIVRAK